RKLAEYLRQDNRLKREYDKRSHIEKYLPHVGIALQEILGLSDGERDQSVARLDDVLQHTRKLP
ncbi:MAG: hypothetical protein WBO37_12295, partial [Gammaproteobacteria bacterium]